VRVEEVIGQRMHDARERQGMTQEELGRKIGERLGREWPRQAVSSAERGGRTFGAAEMVAIAAALGTSVGNLLLPPRGLDEVELPGGTMSRTELVAAAVHAMSTDFQFDAMFDSIARLGKDADLISGEVELLREMVARAAVVASVQAGLKDGKQAAEIVRDLRAGDKP
jgi:transcriptional regulator with XRE-family HTH domain